MLRTRLVPNILRRECFSFENSIVVSTAVGSREDAGAVDVVVVLSIALGNRGICVGVQ